MNTKQAIKEMSLAALKNQATINKTKAELEHLSRLLRLEADVPGTQKLITEIESKKDKKNE